MERNYQTDDICTSMRKQMAVIWRLCDKYPSVDFYRMKGTRRNGIRITIMGSDMAEVWTEEPNRIKSINKEFVGSVISNFVTDRDKVLAVPVKKRDYSAMGENVFGKYAYQSTWGYKWIRFAQTYDELYEIIEQVVQTYGEETGTDLFCKRAMYEKERYRSIVEKITYHHI